MPSVFERHRQASQLFGAEVKTRHADRDQSRAVKTRIDTFYCLPCRKERHAAGGIADCEITDGRVKLTALCEVCGTVVSKPVSKANIPETARSLDLKITRH